MGFEAFHAVNDLCSGTLKFVGTVEVSCLIEACLEFDKSGDMLAVFRRLDQRVDDAGFFGGAVENLLDGDDIRIAGGLFDQAKDWIE